MAFQNALNFLASIIKFLLMISWYLSCSLAYTYFTQLKITCKKVQHKSLQEFEKQVHMFWINLLLRGFLI